MTRVKKVNMGLIGIISFIGAIIMYSAAIITHIAYGEKIYDSIITRYYTAFKMPPEIVFIPDNDLSCKIEQWDKITYSLSVLTQDDLKKVDDKINQMSQNWRETSGFNKSYGEKVKKLYLVSASGRKIRKIETHQMGNRYIAVLPNEPTEPSKGINLGDLCIGRLSHMQGHEKDPEMIVSVYFDKQEKEPPSEIKVKLLKKPINDVYQELGISYP